MSVVTEEGIAAAVVKGLQMAGLAGRASNKHNCAAGAKPAGVGGKWDCADLRCNARGMNGNFMSRTTCRECYLPWNAEPHANKKGNKAQAPAPAPAPAMAQDAKAAKEKAEAKALRIARRKEARKLRNEKRKQEKAQPVAKPALEPAKANDEDVEEMEVEEKAQKSKGLEKMYKLLGITAINQDFSLGDLYRKPPIKPAKSPEERKAIAMKGDACAAVASKTDMLKRLQQAREPLKADDGMANLLDQEIARAKTELAKAEKNKPGSAVQLEKLQDGKKKAVDVYLKASQKAVDDGTRARERHEAHLTALDEAISTLQQRRSMVASHFEEVQVMWQESRSQEDEQHAKMIDEYDIEITTLTQAVVSPKDGTPAAANIAKVVDLTDLDLEYPAAAIEDLPKTAPTFLKENDTALTTAHAFYTLYRYRSLPVVKYSELGATAEVVEAMVGSKIWEGVYGHRVGTVDDMDLVPRQLHLIFGQALMKAMESVAKDAEAEKVLVAATQKWQEFDDRRLKDAERVY